MKKAAGRRAARRSGMYTGTRGKAARHSRCISDPIFPGAIENNSRVVCELEPEMLSLLILYIASTISSVALHTNFRRLCVLAASR